MSRMRLEVVSVGALFLVITGCNVMPVRVVRSGLSPNIPLTDVQLCIPDSDTCQTIPMLVDTGSAGIRVPRSWLTLSLPQENNGYSDRAECEGFATAASWGPVAFAGVKLAREPAIVMRIQVMDDTFGDPKVARDCIKASGSYGRAIIGFSNGIVAGADSGQYYDCRSGTCTPVALEPTNQVRNPVRQLPGDNNGIVIQLPDIPLEGVPQADGRIVLGIGTSFNNDPRTASSAQGAVNVLPRISYVNFFRSVVGVQRTIDSGANFTYVQRPVGPDGPLPHCGEGWYCPKPPVSTVTTFSSGDERTRLPFQIDIADYFGRESKGALKNIASDFSGFFTDTEYLSGIPFFFGKDIYFGYGEEGSPAKPSNTSPLGRGPLIAVADKPTYDRLRIDLRTGSDDARDDSEVWIGLSSQFAPFCFKRSSGYKNNGVCAMDAPPPTPSECSRNTNLQDWTTCRQTFTLPVPRYAAADVGELSIRLVQYPAGFENWDDWNVQGVRVALYDSSGHLPVLRAEAGDFETRHNANCLARLKHGAGVVTLTFDQPNPSQGGC